MSPPGGTRPGTVGRHFPHVELRVADDGELLIRGPNTFARYRNQPELTRETLDAEGWVHSGDLGAVDADGTAKDHVAPLAELGAANNTAKAAAKATPTRFMTLL